MTNRKRKVLEQKHRRDAALPRRKLKVRVATNSGHTVWREVKASRWIVSGPTQPYKK